MEAPEGGDARHADSQAAWQLSGEEPARQTGDVV